MLTKRHIRVPDFYFRGILRRAFEQHHLRNVIHGAVSRMRLKRAKQRRNIALLTRFELLIAKEKHLVLVQKRSNFVPLATS